MNKIFKDRYANWAELEKRIASLEAKKEKGDAFEEFAYFYFQYFNNLYQIDQIYCPIATGENFPKEVVERLNLEKNDYGVDGVFKTSQDKWIAFQAKFRSGRQPLTYSELSTFWTESEYADGRLLITNSSSIPAIANKKFGHLLVSCEVLDGLEAEFFNALFEYTKEKTKEIKKNPKQPREYQKQILRQLDLGLIKNPRGKLIAACGIGKTLLALWLAEKRNDRAILFLAPSLQLVRQTLGEWSNEAQEPFRYLCVCSDQSVDLDDGLGMALSEIDIPVTTEPKTIAEFLSKNKDQRRIIFSTYQSVRVIADAIKQTTFPGFDIAFYDEAHRTAGVGAENLFSLAIDDRLIPAQSRIFMTATERLVGARVKKFAEGENQTVFSMDDPEKYGEVFFKLSFGQAIKEKIVSDYRIVFAGIGKSDLVSDLEKNKYVSQEGGSDSAKVNTAQDIYRRVLLKKCFSELGIRKVITFHSKVSEAKDFALQFDLDLLETVEGSTAVMHVNGSMSSSERSENIRAFESADYGVLTNVRCLTEGVDIPMIDAIYFANPKGSLIDIVQAVGRALRQPYGSSGKMAYIIIPVLIDEALGGQLTGDAYDELFNVIQAMRDQDESLAEWIDEINLGVVSGRSQTGRSPGKLKLIVPPSFNSQELESALLLKIADVNRDPSNHIGVGGQLGKNQRKSAYTRIFKTICDYTPQKLNESLVAPTLEKVSNTATVMDYSELKINNNNVSHCEKLGVLKKVSSKKYQLTPLGINLKNNKINFLDLFKNQILLYSYSVGEARVYPYREAFQYMKKMKQMGFVDFIYGLYSIQVNSIGGVLLDDSITRAQKVLSMFPNISFTSEGNKQEVLTSLNLLHPVGFSYNDIWTDRTTTGNQFRYFLRHLELFSELFNFKDGKLELEANGVKGVEKYLTLTESMLGIEDYGVAWWIKKRINE